MKQAPTPANESKRLQALHNLDILDTESEKQFDALVKLAADLANTPIALLSLVDSNRQWFKSREGLAAQETPRDIAFCSHAILSPHQPFVVDDPLKDERFSDNPLVVGDLNIRFYAGFPVKSPSTDLALGTLCVIHDKPHALNDNQIASLKILAEQVEHLFALRENAKVLIEQQRALEIAVKSKSQFLSTMSHEIRTPLNGIIGSSQLLNTSTMDGDNKKHVSTILNCSTVLLDLINNILDLSKVNEKKSKPKLKPLNIRSLIEQVVIVTHPYLLDKPHLSIHVDVASDIPERISLDSSHTRQILLNLLSNACKFSQEGTITLSVSLKLNRLIISVRDPGRGISEEDQASIFEPFFQARNNHNTQKGSGLGLNIIKSFVELLEGEITCNSVINQGSEFTVSLPYKKAYSQSSKPDENQSKPDYALLNKTILIADDVQVNRLVIESLLAKLGCKVLSANDGRELLSFIGRDIDLIITDIHMPEMDGYQATTAWREKDLKTPIVALTADITSEVQARCKTVGMNAILTKPVRLDELYHCIIKHTA